MIQKELYFEYDINYNYLFDIICNNNSEILKIIDDLKEYRQGNWKENKRKDVIHFKFKDAPLEIIKDGNIPLKLKIKLLENTSNNIKCKIKIRLLNKLLNIISKIINTEIYFELININDRQTKVIIRYIIKTLLPSEINDKIENYIDTKLNNNFIKKFDYYLKDLAIKINNG